MYLTEKEKIMLFTIAENMYADGNPGAVIDYEVLEYSGPGGERSVPGIISSMQKKGLVETSGKSRGSECVMLTPKGIAEYKRLKSEGYDPWKNDLGFEVDEKEKNTDQHDQEYDDFGFGEIEYFRIVE